MAPLRCSIIIPTFNRAGFLSKAIESVLRQMLAGDELIIVDDGSDDDTPEVLDRYRDQITVIRLPHVGAGKARNIGIARAKNELVAFLDSDDYWFPFKLELQRAFMQQRPDLLFCFTNFEVQLRDGSVRSRYLELWPSNHANLEDAFGPGYPYSAVTPTPQGVSDFMVYEGDLYRLQLTGLYVLTDTLVARREEAGEALSFSEDLTT